jgi:hypothetical protein
MVDGKTVGRELGLVEGVSPLGEMLGLEVVGALGAWVGLTVGVSVGSSEGVPVGTSEGMVVGCELVIRL